MGDEWRPVYYSRSQRQRLSVVEQGESSVSRKRPRSSAGRSTPTPPRRTPPDRSSAGRWTPTPPRHTPPPRSSPGRWTPTPTRLTTPRYYSEYNSDDDTCIINNGSMSQDERGSSRDHESSARSGADGVARIVAEEQPAAEVLEDIDDDNYDRPISAVSRPRTLLHGGSTSTALPESAPAPPESSSSSDSSRNVTVENFSAFDCSICYHPLKAPIFQCTVGHVVCSPCHDKLRHATTCHICRIPIPDGYSRCIAMEQVVDSIRFPCPHAMHGCAERPAYHDHDAHVATCPHKPCHCPAEGCSFVGSVQTTLLDYFVTVMDDEQYTFLLNMEQTAPVCNTITGFCIHPSHTGIVKLGLYYYKRWRRDSTLPSKYLQSSQLDVVCTDLCNGLPSPSSCIPFTVPRWPAAPGGEDGDDIRVTVNYISRDTPATFFLV